MAALYAGAGAQSRQLFEHDASAVKKSGLMRIQIARVLWAWLDGTTAIAAKKTEAAKRAIRALELEQIPWGRGLATMLGGVLAHQKGEAARAQSMLSTGAEQVEAVGAVMYAAAARRFRAQLLAPEVRVTELAAADAWFSQRGVKVPAQFAAGILPGFG